MRYKIRRYITTSNTTYIQKKEFDDEGNLVSETWARSGKTILQAAYVSLNKAKDIARYYHESKKKILEPKKLRELEDKLVRMGKQANYQSGGGLILYIDKVEGISNSSVVKKIEPPFK